MRLRSKFVIILISSLVGYLFVFTFLHLYKIEHKYFYSLCGLFTFLILSLLLIKYCKVTNIYNNEYIFRFPISRKYHKLALNELKILKNLILVPMFISLMLLLKLVRLPSGFGNLGLSFGFIIFAIIGLLFGPYMGFIAGFISDTLGFIFFPPGTPYFFGYTLNAMLSGLIYGLCFYKTKITFTKVLFSRFLVNILINSMLGTIWWSILSTFNYEQAFTYFLTIALPKNLCYLIPQSIVIFIVFKALCPLFVQLNYVDKLVKDNISYI